MTNSDTPIPKADLVARLDEIAHDYRQQCKRGGEEIPRRIEEAAATIRALRAELVEEAKHIGDLTKDAAVEAFANKVTDALDRYARRVTELEGALRQMEPSDDFVKGADFEAIHYSQHFVDAMSALTTRSAYSKSECAHLIAEQASRAIAAQTQLDAALEVLGEAREKLGCLPAAFNTNDMVRLCNRIDDFIHSNKGGE